MPDTNPELTEMLKFDSLDVAEKITGESYKENDDVTALGMLLMMGNNSIKDEMLTAAGDTTYGSDFATQLALFLEMGFEPVLVDPFDGTDYEGGVIKETYMILWHPDGLLAEMESYQVTRRNTAKVYYCWKPNPEIVDDGMWAMTSSGGPFRDGIWPGNHDAREGIKHNLENLRANGEFVTPWVADQFFWFLTYMDSKVEGYDYKAITDERISRLPQHVQDAIRGV